MPSIPHPPPARRSWPPPVCTTSCTSGTDGRCTARCCRHATPPGEEDARCSSWPPLCCSACPPPHKLGSPPALPFTLPGPSFASLHPLRNLSSPSAQPPPYATPPHPPAASRGHCHGAGPLPLAAPTPCPPRPVRQKRAAGAGRARQVRVCVGGGAWGGGACVCGWWWVVGLGWGGGAGITGGAEGGPSGTGPGQAWASGPSSESPCPAGLPLKCASLHPLPPFTPACRLADFGLAAARRRSFLSADKVRVLALGCVPAALSRSPPACLCTRHLARFTSPCPLTFLPPAPGGRAGHASIHGPRGDAGGAHQRALRRLLLCNPAVGGERGTAYEDVSSFWSVSFFGCSPSKTPSRHY